MRKRYKFVIALVALLAALYLNNASWIAGPSGDALSIVSHRGVHQAFHRDSLINDTCRAERIYPPVHDYLENTIPSFAAALEA